MIDLFDDHAVRTAHDHAHLFPPEFLDYLPGNLHVYRAFEREALKVRNKGWQHYSARTIIEVLRHHSALAEHGGEWKLGNNHTPYLARLFALLHPQLATMFDFREAKAVARSLHARTHQQELRQ